MAVSARRLAARVIGEGRLQTQVLKERVEALLGPNGDFIHLVGENGEGRAKARLTITDVFAAETIEMRDLLESRLDAEGEPRDIRVNEAITIYSTAADVIVDNCFINRKSKNSYVCLVTRNIFSADQ